jgi:uncharacterized protein YcbX
MLLKVKEDGSREKMQLASFPQCSLFEQQIREDEIINVQYHAPTTPLGPSDPTHATTLKVPLHPDISQLEPVDVDLHGSHASAYRMGEDYDRWFSACFGFRVMLVFIGDGRRPVLGTLAPRSEPTQKGWLAQITSLVSASGQRGPDWLAFTDCAPFLVTSEASLRNVSSRLSNGVEAEMYKFRPNIVVDGEGAWDEDFWAELTVNGGEDRLLLTANCGRCTSLNVDYETGRQADGELGTVLKKLMKDRRVDKGTKWAPIFGRYAFLNDDKEATVSVGDQVEVSRRNTERTVWDWPGLG